MSDRLAALQLFTRVARLGSFSAAGRELGIPQSTVSRTIAGLERHVGTALLLRSTRAVKLTDAGLEFLSRIEPLLTELDDAQQTARGDGALKGSLRVGLGSSLAVREVIPRLPAFLNIHPGLQVDLMVAEYRQDLLVECLDLALRFGTLPDSTAHVRRINEWPRVLAVSQDYLRRAGALRTPGDLANHSIIAGPVSTSPIWSFSREGKSTSVRVNSRLRIAGNEGAIAAARAGMGIVMTSSGSLRAEFGSGMLMQVLTDWDAGLMELNAVYPGGRTIKRAATMFTDFLVEALRDV